jgi:hypothetical protein
MSNTHLITHENGFTRVKFLVNPSYEHVKLMINEVAESYPYEKRLWDMSDVKIKFTTGQIKAMAAHGKTKFIKPNKLAIYVVDDLAFGQMRQFEVYREEEGKSESRVFRNEQNAIEWLNS